MEDRKVFKHPSYGMIGISQISGNATLVGSAVKHQHFISLRIHEAERHHELCREWWFACKPIVEVNLSHAQLAEMLFSINHRDGVPCTLRYVDSDGGGLREPPPYESPFKEATENLQTALHKMLERAEEFAREARSMIAKGITSKKDKDKLVFLADCIISHVRNNVGFASKSVDEKMEKTIAHAKAEIETFVDLKFKLAGIEAYKEKVVSLPTPDEQEAIEE